MYEFDARITFFWLNVHPLPTVSYERSCTHLLFTNPYCTALGVLLSCLSFRFKNLSKKQMTPRLVVSGSNFTLRPCSHLVPEYDSRWALMWTHLFFKYPRQNSGTVPVPEYKVKTLYLGTKVGTDILGTQCLNTAPFCAGAWALVLGHQVWTRPNTYIHIC